VYKRQVYDGVPFYFLQGWPFFGIEAQVYDGGGQDIARYVFFNQAAMAAAWELRTRLGWFPQVIHANDWHTGLLPFLIHESRHDPAWQQVSTMMTIHNIAYQGDYAGGYLWEAGIAGRHQPDLVYQDKTDNLLAIGIAYADLVTTVSPRYAIEIQYPYMGYGLDGLIRTRAADTYGILNGIDMERWNPATDPLIAVNFDADNFMEKRGANKRQLQIDTGLEVRDNILLVGLVSRLEEQKGLDLVIPALRRLLVSTDMQFVGLGTGSPHYNHQVWQLGHDFHWRARTYIEHNLRLAQRIYAGCDIFLMPSYYEPCGMGQMIAMRYGALPLVRETGGLADTVANYDNGAADIGTGFVFNWTEANALLSTLRWALDTYHHRPDAWRRMQERGMRMDFSWDKSARQYIELYERLAGV
jgi:starch synthase